MVGKSVAENLNSILSRIEKAARVVGRQPSEVKLVAVSKTKPLELIDEAAHAGQKIFAENYVQELLPKVEARPNLDWHFIGRLQTNKVKQLTGQVSLIHSVDRVKLAEEISKVAQHLGLVQDILLQVHVGDEKTKAGASADELPEFLRCALALPGIRVCGLMSLPPLSESEEVARGYFAQVNEMFQNCRKKMTESERLFGFEILSIGTSGDFEWAILEGATHVRVGTAIFGERN